MGYDSTFSGSMTPSKKIPQSVVELINMANLDVRIMDEPDDDADGDLGDLVPSMRTMHGYEIEKDIFKVQRLLSKHGIVLNGEIERVGEDTNGDFSKVEAVKGKIYVRQGEITYGKRTKIGMKSVTRYSIRVFSVAEKGKARNFIGWLGNKPLGTSHARDIIGAAPNGLLDYNIPRYEAFSTDDRKAAQQEASEAAKELGKKYVYEVAQREEML